MAKKTNCYTLGLSTDLELIPIFKNNLQLIDEFTTNFKSQDELVNYLVDKYELNPSPEGVFALISYQQNKVPKVAEVLYSADREFFNSQKLSDITLAYCANTDFVLNLDGCYQEKTEIQGHENYNGNRQQLLDLKFKQYKRRRDLYLLAKKYKEMEQNKNNQNSLESNTVEITFPKLKEEPRYSEKQLTLFDLKKTPNIKN